MFLQQRACSIFCTKEISFCCQVPCSPCSTLPNTISSSLEQSLTFNMTGGCSAAANLLYTNAAH